MNNDDKKRLEVARMGMANNTATGFPSADKLIGFLFSVIDEETSRADSLQLRCFKAEATGGWIADPSAPLRVCELEQLLSIETKRREAAEDYIELLEEYVSTETIDQFPIKAAWQASKEKA